MEDGGWGLLLAVAGLSAGFALVAIGSPGWWRLPMLWLSASMASIAVFVVCVLLGVDSLRGWLALALLACTFVALTVWRWAVVARSRRIASLPVALCASTFGAITPLLSLYALLLSAGSGGGID